MTHKKGSLHWVGPSRSQDRYGFIEDCFFKDQESGAIEYFGFVERLNQGLAELSVPDENQEEMLVVGEYDELKLAKEALTALIESTRQYVIIDTFEEQD